MTGWRSLRSVIKPSRRATERGGARDLIELQYRGAVQRDRRAATSGARLAGRPRGRRRSAAQARCSRGRRNPVVCHRCRGAWRGRRPPPGARRSAVQGPTRTDGNTARRTPPQPVAAGRDGGSSGPAAPADGSSRQTVFPKRTRSPAVSRVTPVMAAVDEGPAGGVEVLDSQRRADLANPRRGGARRSPRSFSSTSHSALPRRGPGRSGRSRAPVTSSR